MKNPLFEEDPFKISEGFKQMSEKIKEQIERIKNNSQYSKNIIKKWKQK